jgi:hypothetical protein
MSAPTKGDHRKLKRLVRYLIGAPRVITKYPWQKRQHKVTTYSDADWAGCRKTGKPTSGGAIMIGAHFIKSWASTQKNITLSSGESELVAVVKASSETLGMMQLAADWGQELEGEIMVDASAALGVVRRKGCGKLRHVRVGLRWVQEKEEEGELKYRKVDGAKNPADLMTKGVPPKLLETHLAHLGLWPCMGRAHASLQATRGK